MSGVFMYGSISWRPRCRPAAPSLILRRPGLFLILRHGAMVWPSLHSLYNYISETRVTSVYLRTMSVEVSFLRLKLEFITGNIALEVYFCVNGSMKSFLLRLEAWVYFRDGTCGSISETSGVGSLFWDRGDASLFLTTKSVFLATDCEYPSISEFSRSLAWSYFWDRSSPGSHFWDGYSGYSNWVTLVSMLFIPDNSFRMT